MFDDLILGAATAFAIATLTTPVGISGAVFLVPVQISLLHTPSPSLTPTNLLYNLIAIPGALVRYRRTGEVFSPLARLLAIGALPGVVLGAVIRVEFLSGSQAFLAVVAAVLVPLGIWLTFFPRVGETARLRRPRSNSPRLPSRLVSSEESTESAAARSSRPSFSALVSQRLRSRLPRSLRPC